MFAFQTLLCGLLTMLPPGGPEPVKIEVFPTQVSLTHARDRQGLVVQAIFADGSGLDVTDASNFNLDPPIASIKNGFLAPLADGKANLTVIYRSRAVKIPVQVSDAQKVLPLSFRNDVMAVISRAGCNTGKCHGAASGKDGFRLSLFGYDPEGDYFRITREMGGRRLNLASPENCLLLNKSTGRVPHTGGMRVEPDSESYKILTTWLDQSAPTDPAESRVLVGIDVYPKEAVFAKPGFKHRLVVRARYSDGTDLDVTRFSVFVGNNESAAKVGESGLLTATGPGEAFIMARFDKFTEGSAIIVRSGKPFEKSVDPKAGEIDNLVLAKLDKLHIRPSGLCDDETFLRRAYIDLIGLLPSETEYDSFMADQSVDKREKLVDKLISRPDFGDLWAMKWAELFQIRTTNGISDKALKSYDGWLRSRISKGESIDSIVRELIPAVGGSFDNPPVNYFQTETSPQILAENVAQVFLGTRIQCAQCHNHPFDRWTMDDYYGFAAFFSRVGYKGAMDPRELTIFNTSEGGISHPVTSKSVKPKFLGGDEAKIPPGTDYRNVLSTWLTTPDNPAFARNFGNIVWAHFFGIGIVEPVDDSRVSNPPSNPQLLDLLARKAVEYRFDVKRLAREICLSKTYQRQTSRNETNLLDNRNFSRQTARRMRAEILLDCINQVTGTTDSYRGLPEGGRAIRIPDGAAQNYFLSTFGRSERETACTCNVKNSPTLSQALHLLNGETTGGKISSGTVVPKLVQQLGDPNAVATALYLRCLGRRPSRSESEKIKAALAQSGDPQIGLEDLFWALLNTNEFLFNR